MSKYCEWCGKELDETKNRFCNTSCSAYWRNKFKPHSMSEEGRKHNAEILRNRWKDKDFRQKKIEYMKTNNPSFSKEVIEKTKKKMLEKGYTNNFKYGNGIMSEYEYVVWDILQDYGFEYNKSISVNNMRLKYPDKHYPTNYKPDFTHTELKICVEVDGPNHKFTSELDDKKDECLRLLGYKVFRFTHEDINKGKLWRWLEEWPNY